MTNNICAMVNTWDECDMVIHPLGIQTSSWLLRDCGVKLSTKPSTYSGTGWHLVSLDLARAAKSGDIYSEQTQIDY
jgi:hypothetical protein